MHPVTITSGKSLQLLVGTGHPQGPLDIEKGNQRFKATDCQWLCTQHFLAVEDSDRVLEIKHWHVHWPLCASARTDPLTTGLQLMGQPAHYVAEPIVVRAFRNSHTHTDLGGIRGSSSSSCLGQQPIVNDYPLRTCRCILAVEDRRSSHHLRLRSCQCTSAESVRRPYRWCMRRRSASTSRGYLRRPRPRIWWHTRARTSS